MSVLPLELTARTLPVLGLCLSRDRAEAGNSEYQRNTGEEVDLVKIVVNKLSCEEKARDWTIPRRNFGMTGVC